MASLPDSYAICTDGGTIYTVDEKQPSAECLLVRRDRLHAVGSRGVCSKQYRQHVLSQAIDHVLTAWNDYQLEMAQKFYGGELSTKKPIPLFYVRPGAVVVPGLAGP